MTTKVQSKTYVPGSMMDLNNGFPSGTREVLWEDLYPDDRTSDSRKSNCYDPFLVRQTMHQYLRFLQDRMRETMLKQESIFRHQLEELHRVYKRQRDLMNELTMKEDYKFSMPAEASKSSHFLSQVPSRITKDVYNSSQVDSTFGRVSISESNSIFSSHNPLKGKCILKENVSNLSTERAYNLADLNEPIQAEEPSFAASLINKNSVIENLQKQDSSANSNSGFLYSSKISQQNLKERDGQIAGGDHIVGERHKKEQLSYSFVDGKCYDNGCGNGNFSQQNNVFQAEPKKSREHFLFPVSDQNKVEPRRKSTIFGVELCERSHTPSFDSSQSSSWDQNTSIIQRNHWLGSYDASRQIPEDFAGNKQVNNSSSRFMTHSRAGVPYQNGINSKVSVSDILEKPDEKNNVTDGQKNHENLEKGLPSWLMAKSSLGSEWTKGKEPTIYQMNLDSLQHHSQQFFKKTEMTKGAHDPKVQTDNSQGITRILGVPITDVPDNSKDLANHGHDLNDETKDFVKENGKNNCILELRHHIDLNLAFEEEETPSTSYIPEAIVKIARREIDLEAPVVLESETETETDPPEIMVDTSKLPLDETSMDAHEDLVKVAAEAIMSISSSELLPVHQKAPEPADTLLRWFAEVIASGDDKDSGNVKDDEESITKGMDYFEYMTLKLQESKEEYYMHNEPMILEEKEEVRKRTTKGKRGRQRKDFQRDVLPSIVSLSRREVSEDLQTFEEAFSGIGVSWQSSLSKRKGAGGKNGRGRRRLVVPSSSSSHTPPSPPPQEVVCREVALEEKSLSGWGKRTRRLPRQRSCQNGGGGGGNHQSLALKC
ncbi:uncharacterized protein LOC112507596 [Cynara cardunculus var. scolymus]|uniref:Uncharacterized protein n=1 Tax=Cynara cardunculus var. scolymus TaxID=59895 RepID=A0A103YHD8_CYNCS|nr:uncharacterized protein LOC112507596 [Cynara cardunculus var. scolymus]XP_024968022.1 uncharacterized protein LOC112507596 [Cynara cardunculus var. scolymus]KVI09139.1 Protein of unknown function DUF863, plant [Cynara cardunculus var. scolymus]